MAGFFSLKGEEDGMRLETRCSCSLIVMELLTRSVHLRCRGKDQQARRRSRDITAVCPASSPDAELGPHRHSLRLTCSRSELAPVGATASNSPVTK
jgi:hypothetical protein